MGEQSADVLAGSGGLSSHVYARYRVPNHEAFLTHLAVVLGAKAMAAGTKVVTNETVRRKKSLRMAS
jgi:hypothetical protein